VKAPLLALSLLAAGPALAHKPTTTKFTYHRDVYPILLARCGACHRPGGVGPMSLLTYKETYPWAVSIKNEVLALRMPPWFADERSGEFQHRKSLSASEVDTIVDWCLGGTPEGDGPAGPPSSIAGISWARGEPDLVLAMPEAFTLDSGTSDAVAEVRLETGLDEDRWLTAIDVRPGRPSVVRSALVFRERAAPENVIASWVPDQDAAAPAADGRRRLRKRATLVLRVHYEKTWLDEGKSVSDRSEVGLYFDERERGREVETVVVESGGDPMGAGRPGFEATFERSLPDRVDVVALFPWLEAPLTSLRAEAVLPGGETRELIRLREPGPDWPRKYVLGASITLPAGSRLQVTLAAPEEEPLRKAHALLLDVIRD
jgi:hypothetical protein